MKKIVKQLYNLIPFKKQIFLSVKFLFHPSENIYRHLSFNQVFKVKVDDDSSFLLKHYGFQMENEIFWEGLRGGWEKISMNLWIDLCREADVVFDIGANTGVYSLVAKTVNRQSAVYAFEPVQRVFEKLEANNDLNKFDIKCFSEAVSDFNGEATIYDTSDEHIYSVTVNKNLNVSPKDTFEVKIKTITLDSIIEQNHLQKIDLIKIDVETHEAEVLKGFSKHIRIFRPTMVVEILNDEVGRNVQELLSGLNYLYFNIDERKGIRQVQEITKSDFYNYLICDEATAKKLKLIL